MLVLPDGVNSCMRTDLTDLDLSSIDSVPTSRRPIDFGSIEYLRSSEETVVRASEYISTYEDYQPCSTINDDKLTFAVVAEAHLRLPEANCIFPCGNAIEFLKFCLVHTLDII